MQKYISFMRLTEKGQITPPEKVAEIYTKMLGITESYGGKTLEVWTALAEYDFVAITEFPTAEAAFKTTVKINQLGVARFFGAPTFPVDAYLAAAAEKKELVAV